MSHLNWNTNAHASTSTFHFLILIYMHIHTRTHQHTNTRAHNHMQALTHTQQLEEMVTAFSSSKAMNLDLKVCTLLLLLSFHLSSFVIISLLLLSFLIHDWPTHSDDQHIHKTITIHMRSTSHITNTQIPTLTCHHSPHSHAITSLTSHHSRLQC